MHFFTADTHFGHRRILSYCRRKKYLTSYELECLKKDGRYFDPSIASLERMDQGLIDNINAIVGKNDTLWHLGDFCFGPKDKIEQTARRYRDRIKCKTINLIWGNHDRHEIASVFTRTFERTSLKYEDRTIIMDHYAHAVWNKSHHGAWQLYGHSHGTAEDWLDKHMAGRRSIDVGVDCAFSILGEYRPFSFEELRKILDQRPGHSIDHHKEE